MKDVYEEVDELMSRMRVGMHKIKPCSRKYAFELPDVPKEADYLKLLYSYESMSTSSSGGTLLTRFQNRACQVIFEGKHSHTCSEQIRPCSSNSFYGGISRDLAG